MRDDKSDKGGKDKNALSLKFDGCVCCEEGEHNPAKPSTTPIKGGDFTALSRFVCDNGGEDVTSARKLAFVKRVPS